MEKIESSYENLLKLKFGIKLYNNKLHLCTKFQIFISIDFQTINVKSPKFVDKIRSVHNKSIKSFFFQIIYQSHIINSYFNQNFYTKIPVTFNDEYISRFFLELFYSGIYNKYYIFLKI